MCLCLFGDSNFFVVYLKTKNIPCEMVLWRLVALWWDKIACLLMYQTRNIINIPIQIMTHPRMAPIKIIVLLSVMLGSPLSETINYIKNITVCPSQSTWDKKNITVCPSPSTWDNHRFIWWGLCWCSVILLFAHFVCFLCCPIMCLYVVLLCVFTLSYYVSLRSEFRVVISVMTST